MRKIISISLLLVSSVLIFVSSAETKRTGSPFAAIADLSVSKVDTPDPVNTGSNLTYTITVTNNGPDAAANASWSDALPSGTTFVSISNVGGWSCTAPDAGDNGTVSCSNASFAVGSAVFTLTVAVAPNVTAGSVLTNSATATSTALDINTGNNTGTATTTVRSPAIVAGNKSVSGGNTPGSTVSYLIILSNSSGSDQQDNPGNEFTDVLSADLTLVSADASAGTATANTGANTVTWNGVVPAADSVTITITATIKPGTTGHTISNTGAINYDADGNGTNEASANTNTVNFDVGAAGTNADMMVVKTASADTIAADSDVTYTITVRNNGPDTATSATLTDTLPLDMTFVSLSQPAGWSCNSLTPGSGGTLTCSRNLTVASGAQVFSLVGHIPPGAANDTVYSNMATVTTTATDPTSENNTSIADTTVGCITDPIVTNNADSGAGSLRQAIKDACVGSMITFSGAVTSPVTLSSGELVINKNLKIQGPGANSLTINGNSASRVFNIQSGTVTISGLTITGGKVTSGNSAGGVLNKGTLTLMSCTISGNNAANGGGGIVNDGQSSTATLTIINSTISGNIAPSFGAGLLNNGSNGNATANIINSTISGNGNPSFGGGIYNEASSGSATLNITNSTIAGNTAASSGGGIFNNGNTGTAVVNLNNTIVSDNTGPNAANGPDIFNAAGTISGSNNLIKTNTGYTISGSNNINADPLLEKDGLGNLVLKNNGGPTKTHLLRPGSPAINAGNNANLPADTFDLDGDSNTAEPLPVDQRGFNRIVVANVDIGAVETNYTITATAGTPQSAIINSAFATALKSNVKESGVNQSGVPVTFTAPGSGASGTFSSSATVNTDGSGVATAPTFTANGIAGSYNVVAGIGTSLPTASFALTNTPAATTTAVTSSPNPSNFNQSVTFTATVTSASGTPTGTVQFKVDGTNVGSPQTLNGSGVATFATSALSAGIHTVTANYNGDGNFNPSSGTLSGGQTVGVIFQFSAAVFNTTESSFKATITVQRTGDPAPAATVDFATPDDSATTTTILPCSTPGFVSSRCDFTSTTGTLRFAANESTKTFDVLISQDNYVEGNESFPLTLSNPSNGAALGSQSTATLTIADDVTEPAANPIDDSTNFVRQHYHDFLNREPDAAGLTFWTNQIESCGADQNCRSIKRQNVSAAFYLSIEFQQTGYFVYLTYKTAFGDINPPTVPVPVRYLELTRDSQELQRGVIVGVGNWQAQLDANKQAYALAFVSRSAFLTRYPGSTTATAFVDALNANAGNVLTGPERTSLINGLSSNPSDPAARANVLMTIAENSLLKQQQFNRAFVLMEYFGYLRRNPDAAPDSNFAGYNFWLNKLNAFNGNFMNADMVKAFITSGEYRNRFGQ